MKYLIFALMTISLSLSQAADKISIAYPGSGSVIAGQIGLILERTDTLKIHGFDASIKRVTFEDLNAGVIEGKYDLIITTEPQFIKLSDKNAKIAAISSLGVEDNFQLLNVINKVYMEKHKQIEDKINNAFVDAFYYLITHKEEVNKWYAGISKLTPEAVDSASRVNKNYNAKGLSEINIKIKP